MEQDDGCPLAGYLVVELRAVGRREPTLDVDGGSLARRAVRESDPRLRIRKPLLYPLS
jgi:hypothetical protein